MTQRSGWKALGATARFAGPVLAVLIGFAPASADLLKWEGAFALDPLGAGLPTIVVTATGLASAEPAAPGFALETLALGGASAHVSTVPVTDPVVTAGGVVALRLSAAPGAGTLGPFFPPAAATSPQLTRAVLPVPGALRLCLLYVGCFSGIDVPLFGGPVLAPAGVGVGGSLVAGLTVPVSVLGAPWTVRTAFLDAQTASGASVSTATHGWVHGAYSFTGSTARPGGSLQLVSPVVVQSTQGSHGATAFARLTLTFVPEPRSLLLFGVGGAALAVVACRRRG